MKKFLISPYALADIFMESEYKENFRYIRRLNQWLFFDQYVWVSHEARDDLYQCLTKLLFQNIPEEERNNLDYDIDKIVRIAIENLKLRSYIKIRLDDLDKHKNFLNCKNGVLNLDTLEFIPHKNGDTKKYFITVYADVCYNPTKQCPNFEEFIKNIFEGYNDSPEIILWLQQILGYAISGYTYEQSFYFLSGNGANGKTTLIETIKELLGTYACALNKSYFIKGKKQLEKFHYFYIKPKRFLSVTEFDAKDKINESIIKQITGNDLITFSIDKEEINCKLDAKLFFTTNNLPKCTDGGLSMSRRMKIVSLKNDFSANPDLTRLDKLSEERSGILNWLVKGYQSIDKSKPIKMPKELEKISKAAQNDTINNNGMFIERFLIRDDEHAITLAQAVGFLECASHYTHGVHKKDLEPRFLALTLKRYCSKVIEFDSKTPKIYLGVGISSAEEMNCFNAILRMDVPQEDFTLSTDIESQLEHYKIELEDAIKKDEVNSNNPAKVQHFYKSKQYVEFFENYYKQLYPDSNTMDNTITQEKQAEIVI